MTLNLWKIIGVSNIFKKEVEAVIERKQKVIDTLEYFFLNPLKIVDVKLQYDCDTEVAKGIWMRKIRKEEINFDLDIDLDRYNSYIATHEKGSVLSAHYHNSEKIMNIKGSIDLYVYNTETHEPSNPITIPDGEIVELSPFIPHAIKANELSQILILLKK